MKKNFFFFLIFNLVVLMSTNIHSQNETIGYVERIHDDINNYIAVESKVEVLASGFSWSEGPVWS